MDKKKLSNKHEKDIAEAFNGRVQIASGAIPLVGMKGDVVSPDYLIECKATTKTFYSLKRKVVEKIEKEALKCGRTPILAIRVSNADYVLYRIFDFDDEVLEDGRLECVESLKLTQEFFTTLKEDYCPIRIGNTLWGLLPLQIFSEKYLEGDFK